MTEPTSPRRAKLLRLLDDFAVAREAYVKKATAANQKVLRFSVDNIEKNFDVVVAEQKTESIAELADQLSRALTDFATDARLENDLDAARRNIHDIVAQLIRESYREERTELRELRGVASENCRGR